MRKWSKISASLVMGAVSVYSAGAGGANPEASAVDADSKGTPSDVKLIDSLPTSPTPRQSAGSESDHSAAPDPAHPAGAPSMKTNSDGTFTLNITKDADILDTLRVIGFQAQKSVLPSKDVHGPLPALDLYNVTVHEALDAILKVNGYAYKDEGNFIYVYSAKEVADMEKANHLATTEVFRTFYTPAANAVVMIKPVLSAEGQVAITAPALSGIETGTKDTGGNSHSTEDILVVTDYPENLERVRKVLKEIDRRPQQILIEATIMQASLSEDNQLGVNFTALGGVDFSTLNASSGSSTPTGLLPSAVNGTILNTSGTGGITDKGYVAAQAGGNGLQLGIVKNNLGLFINALEGVTNTTVLANPKILALNKQKGEVIVGRQDGYVTTTVTDNASIQTVQFLDTGTRLIFRPYIGDDGYIRMEIHPEDSSGGLTASNLPFKITTEVTSNVMVKDGHTIVIGGLFRESSNTTRSQVPLLGNLPLAGYLFRQQRDQTTREEIIILLTPHIVKDDSVYSEESQKEMNNAEKLRVGVRQGMMPFGRERLAETNYEQAVSEMRKEHPDQQKALWHLDCATNLNPTFLEAIQMKESLTGTVLTTADNSSVRSFLSREIIAERNAPVKPAVDVPQAVVPINPMAAPRPAAPATTPSVTADPPAGNIRFGVATWGMHSLWAPVMNWLARWDGSARETIAMAISRRQMMDGFPKPAAVSDTNDAADGNR